MLINLKTIHKPQSLVQAAELLNVPDVYPLYGSGAWLVRSGISGIDAAVDLSPLVSQSCSADRGGDLALSPAATLETICAGQLADVDTVIHGGLSSLIKSEVPETLRNALTLGDMFMECDSTSLLLTMLSGLQTDVHIFDGESRNQLTMRMRDWFSLTLDQRRQLIITDVRCREYALWRYAFDKVARTPADAPIVAVVAFCRADAPETTAFTVVGGLTGHPAHYLDGMQSTLNDYKGSAEYRTAMARTLSQRALTQVIALAKSE